MERAPCSNRQQFFFLGRRRFIDLGNILISQLLHIGLATLLVIGRDFLVLDQILDRLVGVTPHIADRDLGVLHFALDDLGEVFAALLGERRDIDADGLAGGVRRQAEIGEDRKSVV